MLTHPVNGERYHACAACGLIRKSPKDLLAPEQEFAIYRQHNNSIEDPKYVGVPQRLHQPGRSPVRGRRP